MESLYYIPIEKDGHEFFQREVLTLDELLDYNVQNYNNVIKDNFEEKAAIVNLKTGKFFCKVFFPKENNLDIYFCLVNEKNYPSETEEINIDEDILNTIKENLSLKVKESEGIIIDQIIDLRSNFVTPRIKFMESDVDLYYDSKIFNRNYIIFGAPGSGKTTLLRRLTLDYINAYLESSNRINKIPVYIQLREFNNYTNDFDTFIDNNINNYFSNVNFNRKHNLYNTGNLCLMLDGADEIDFEKFQSFKTTIINYKTKNPLVTFLITSRPDRNYENIEGFDKCYVQPFNSSQIKELTYRKFSKSDKWKDFISMLNSVPGVYEVLKNPLLLTISHFLYLYKSILPVNSGQLMKELVATLISNWDTQRNVERKLENKKISPIEVTNFLGKLSLILSEKQKMQITTTELIDSFSDFDTEKDLTKYLEYVEFATGLVTQPIVGLWSFAHKSIQDFFCSNYLVEGVGQINKKIFVDNNWNEVLMMISGLSSDPNYIVNDILNQTASTEADKLTRTLAVYNESHLLTKRDIKKSVELLERYFLNYERNKVLSNEEIIVSDDKILFKLSNTTHGLKEIISLLKSILKVRFTKYEFDFYGYLKESKSQILGAIKNMSLEKGNISINGTNTEIEISHSAESPEINEE